jgi:hypothetical protein
MGCVRLPSYEFLKEGRAFRNDAIKRWRDD